MKQRDQEPNRDDIFDQQLEAALSKFATAEPRAGLEERILANLRAHSQHAPAPGWWQQAAGALVLAIILLLVLSSSWRTRKPQLVNVPNPITTQPVRDKQVASNPEYPARTVTIRKSPAGRTLHSGQPATAAPHLSQFPSPAAMNDQEKMLADYAAEFQEQAALIARFNEEDLRRDRMELVENAQNSRNDARFDNQENQLR